MLYPDFDELTALKRHAPKLSLTFGGFAASVPGGDHSSPFRGQGLEFEEVREYVFGDDIRGIDWRVTARTGKPHTKVFKEEHERSIIICVDVNEAMRFGTRGTFKSLQAARAASLLGWQASCGRDKLGACLFGDVPDGMRFFEPSRSRASLWGMFKQLSDRSPIPREQPISLEDVLRHINKASPTRALVYVISDFNTIDEEFERQLRNLRKRCNVVLIAIDDPADRIIPPVGMLVFGRSSRERYHVNTDSHSGRKAYTRLWEETRDRLGGIAHRLGIHILSIPTDGNVTKELTLGLKRILKRGGTVA